MGIKTNRSMINEYLEYIEKVKNLTSRTVIEYRKDLGVFVEYAQAQGWTWSTLTRQQVDDWLKYEHDRGMKPGTIKKRLTALRMLLQWAYRQGRLPQNVAWYCQSPKSELRLPSVANVAAIDAYLAQPAVTQKQRRTHLVVALLLETGLRVSEALSIKYTDVDHHERSIKVTGKGRKERVVYFGIRTVKAMANSWEDGDYILHYDNTRRLREDLTNEVGSYVPGIHPHMLRHTFATALINAGCPLKDVSALLGHRHVATTERYAHVANKYLRDQRNKFNF